jgi:exodeoxyribonuclease VII large subunit
MTNNTSDSLPVLTVSQLSQAIKYCLEQAFPIVCLQGEVSNFTQHTSGHLYFSLKDAQAQISAAMFRPDAATLKMLPKNGMQVIVKGEVNVYPIRGNYQIIVKELRAVGVGELLLQLEELKIKLHKRGWFSKERKKPLPKFPRKIGVVTSPTGAAIQDILNILTRRFSGFHLILNPVKVQGEGAAKEIAQAIEQFNAYRLVDVMIVGRGGGSFEDLWSFNEEVVAEAIHNSRIPIICAVGHEIDHCIADYVADVRAPTPSAAAELVVAEKAQQLQHLAQMKRRMQQTLLQLVKQDRHRLNGVLRHPLLQSPYGILGPWAQHLDHLRQACDRSMQQQAARLRLLLEGRKKQLFSLQPANKLKHCRERLRGFKQIFKLVEGSLAYKRERLNRLADALHAVNPKNLLTKGYCILFSEKKDSSITTVQQLEIEERVRILLSDGEAAAEIKELRAYGTAVQGK